MTAVHPVIRRLARAALVFRGLGPESSHLPIGRITLLPHQVQAVRWLRPRLRRFGGALLADPPGLGKTYVALAIAAERGVTPLVIAPAALQDRWKEASRETGIAITFISTERLSAPAPVSGDAPHLVIIDEAHHLRTPSTRRHRRTTDLCGTATVLLLSATPVQNHADDLEHVTTLFHLPPTRQSATHLRRRLTLRRSLAALALVYPDALARHAVPSVRHAHAPPLVLRHPSLPDRLLALPPLRDERDDGHTLLLLGLLHALRSSDAAARERVRRRIAITLAIEQVVSAGVEPTPDVLRAWHAAEGDVQLAMPQLFATTAATIDSRVVDGALRQRRALESILAELSGEGDEDRASVLRRLARWCAGPVVAFTQFASTARHLYRRLRGHPGVALLTGTGARIASGVIDREEVLARLLGAHFRSPRNAVRLLITTDVLSEGLSLAGVTTIVHLDLPWTAARLDQRVGRAARIGAPVREVRVLTLPPALPATATSAMHELLARKRRRMARVVHRNDAELDTVQALMRLHSGDGSASRGRGWVTMWTPGVPSPVVIAIARVGRDRLLVCMDGTGLRAPAADDWLALEHASVSRTRCDGIARLRRALHAWRAEMELSASIRTSQRHRLATRRQADEQLISSERSQRSSLAQHVTAQRIRTGSASREHAGQDAWPGRAAHRTSGDVRILCGVSLLPVEPTDVHRPDYISTE